MTVSVMKIASALWNPELGFKAGDVLIAGLS